MAWIKFEKDLLTDPRVLRIAKALEAKFCLTDTVIPADKPDYWRNAAKLPAVTLVCGALVRIWSMADTHVDSSDVLPLGLDELNEHIGIAGFCQLMPAEWMIPIDEHSVKLPNFHAHNGTEAKKKAVTQKRVAAFRARNLKALPIRNAAALPDQTKTRPRPEVKLLASSAHALSAVNGNAVAYIPLNDGSEFGVSKDLAAELEKLYPAVNVEQTLNEIRGWNLANPAKRKTARGVLSHINTWMAREQNRGPQR